MLLSDRNVRVNKVGVRQETTSDFHAKSNAQQKIKNQIVQMRAVKAMMEENALRVLSRTVNAKQIIHVHLMTNHSVVLSDRNDLWKDCNCWDDTKENHPYKAFTIEDLEKAQAILAGLPEISNASPSPIPSPSADASKVTCWNDNVNTVPAKMVTQTGVVDPDTLIYRLREVVCNDKCETPAGIADDTVIIYQNDDKTDCEISVDIDGDIEAWVYRGSPSQGSQWQQCWDSTENIIKKCINNGPNKGWWNGPDYGQFYETGFRPLNGEGAKHEPSSSEKP
ncbi:hypothetical protein GTA08_BOTSDO01005 [Botryosphaeria dothidea]|uniref:Uncharacterized protein n=1 Tax=Botryosphaeria dothidea TaxID=55169 RepID=A0A8H4J502_9PEZI|nr:hypothetical protein GTA08_BOTSDO01005 [Botryosphaeria dothidea]